MKKIISGKVREVYDLGDCMMIEATDRISAFDRILEQKIPGKGKILTKMSEFWFDFTKALEVTGEKEKPCASIWHGLSFLERIKGVEPSCSAWEADVLPMNYIRKSVCA